MMSATESPFVSPENLEWAQAAERGALLVKHCRSCDRNHYYPRPFCPFCFSEGVEYLQVEGRGRIYTFTVNRTQADPRITAYVTLKEGPTLITEIVGAEPNDVHIDQEVFLDFRPSAMGFPAPVFRITDGGGTGQ